MAGAKTQAQRQAEVLAAGYNGPMTDAAVNQAYANAATPSDLTDSGISNTAAQSSQSQSSGGGGSTSSAASNLGKIQQDLLNAIASGNKAAADEAIREFNLNFGLNQDKFNESVRQYNLDHGLAVDKQAFDQAATAAGITGYWNAPGSTAKVPTQEQAVQQRAAELVSHGYDQTQATQTAQAEYNQGNLQTGNVAFGTKVSFATPAAGQGQLTEAARAARVQEQQAATAEQNRTGLAALTLASTNQGDPFRRLSTQYSLSQNPNYMGGMQAVINGVSGQNGVAQTQAPGASAADSVTLQGLQNSTANTAGTLDPAHMAQFYTTAMNGGGNGATLQSLGAPGTGGDVAGGFWNGSSAPSANASTSTAVPGTPGSAEPPPANGSGGTYAQGQATLAGLPANNKTIARNFNQLGPSAQAAYLSAQSAKSGMSMDDLKAQIQSSLPRSPTAPSFGLATV
jgi:hypothetical protein